MYVDDVVRQCVLFLGNKDQKTGKFIPRATAFVVCLKEEDVGFRYVVTAEHNISGFQQKGWGFMFGPISSTAASARTVGPGGTGSSIQIRDRRTLQ